MSKHQQVLIGDRLYETQKAALDAICTVRENILRNGAPSIEEDEFLRDLVALHPNSDRKVGAGIKRFEVRRVFQNLGFHIIRIDGTDTDFGFKKCVKSAPPQTVVLSAMRYAVINQKNEARERAFGSSLTLICPITGTVMTREDCHVDHYDPTFIELANAFAAMVGGYQSIVTTSRDRDVGQRLQDAATDAAWCEYHAANAHLRVISKPANLSIVRRNR